MDLIRRLGWPIRPRPGLAFAVGLLPRSLRPASLCRRPPCRGRARHSVRAVMANQNAFVGNGGSLQRPAVRGLTALPERRRCGIVVEPQTKIKSSPVGAAYSTRIPDDVAPTGALSIFEWRGYKDSSPTGLLFTHTPAPVPAGLANPAPARPCVGRWPFAPVLASGHQAKDF